MFLRFLLSPMTTKLSYPLVLYCQFVQILLWSTTLYLKLLFWNERRAFCFFVVCRQFLPIRSSVSNIVHNIIVASFLLSVENPSEGAQKWKMFNAHGRPISSKKTARWAPLFSRQDRIKQDDIQHATHCLCKLLFIFCLYL